MSESYHDVVTAKVVRDLLNASEPRYWSRAQIAAALGRNKTTHVISSIEKAVAYGWIEKFAGWVGKRQGWVYAPLGYQPTLIGDEHYG